MQNIFIESKDVAFEGNPAEHLYLVYKDDSGNEFVIRGGPENEGNLSDLGKIVIENNILLNLSKDARGTETTSDRNSRQLNIGSRNAADVWNIMSQHASGIGSANIDYDLLGPNSNSVIASVLNIVGINPFFNLPIGKGTTSFPGVIDFLKFNTILNGTPSNDIFGNSAGDDTFIGDEDVDQYIFPTSGFGKDVVIDDDGQLLFDGNALSGLAKAVSNKPGFYSISMRGNLYLLNMLNDGKDLRIAVNSDIDEPNDYVIIKNFNNGKFGINLGNEFNVHYSQYKTNNPITGGAGSRFPDIAYLVNGNYVIVGENTISSLNCVIYNNEGNIIRSLNINGKYRPSVTALKNGNFVVAWMENDNIYAQFFKSNGDFKTGKLTVDTRVGAVNRLPQVVGLENGEALICWGSTKDTDEKAIYARKFSSNGVPKTSSEFKLADFSSEYSVSLRDLVAISNGGFGIAVVTNDVFFTGTYTSIVRTYNSIGTQSSSLIVSNMARKPPKSFCLASLSSGKVVSALDDGEITSTRTSPCIAPLIGGGYFVAWYYPSDQAIKGDAYNSWGQQVGGFGTMAGSLNAQGAVNLRMSSYSNGDFILTWQKNGVEVGQESTRSKLYKATGIDFSIVGGAGTNTINGRNGNDAFFSIGGSRTFTGQSGSDIFTVVKAPYTETTITDFEHSDPNEKIDLSSFPEITGFGDLTITEGSAIVHLGNNQTIHITNLTPNDLTSNDFTFAAPVGNTTTGITTGLSTTTGDASTTGVISSTTSSTTGGVSTTGVNPTLGIVTSGTTTGANPTTGIVSTTGGGVTGTSATAGTGSTTGFNATSSTTEINPTTGFNITNTTTGVGTTTGNFTTGGNGTGWVNVTSSTTGVNPTTGGYAPTGTADTDYPEVGNDNSESSPGEFVPLWENNIVRGAFAAFGVGVVAGFCCLVREEIKRCMRSNDNDQNNTEMQTRQSASSPDAVRTNQRHIR